MKKQQCFAYKQGECTALNIMDCEACSFYKTTKQVTKERNESLTRIQSLDKRIRNSIMETYYHK